MEQVQLPPSSQPLQQIRSGRCRKPWLADARHRTHLVSGTPRCQPTQSTHIDLVPPACWRAGRPAGAAGQRAGGPGSCAEVGQASSVLLWEIKARPCGRCPRVAATIAALPLPVAPAVHDAAAAAASALCNPPGKWRRARRSSAAAGWASAWPWRTESPLVSHCGCPASAAPQGKPLARGVHA